MAGSLFERWCSCFVCFIGLNVDFTGVVSTVGGAGGGVLREKKNHANGCGGG